MRRTFCLLFCLILLCLAACTPVARPVPALLYLQMGSVPGLALQTDPPAAVPPVRVPLVVPAGCSFWALTPAPAGGFAALEWQCGYGPAVQLANLDSGQVYFLLDDPTVDNRLLAWAADGRSLFLKTGSLSDPQIVRVDVLSRQATRLPLSPNVYNLAPSPDGGRLLYALTSGLGLGSELWSADAQAAGSQRLLADAQNILGLARYSPDGRHIAYIRLPDNQSSAPAGELWLAAADGTGAARLAIADAGRGLPPVWSPDGTRIAFVGRERADDPGSLTLSVYDLRAARLLAPAVALRTLPLSLATAPAWSADGTKLYFTLDSDGKMDVWFYEIQTGKTGIWSSDACCAGVLH